jgi:hypothetical protein
VIGGPRPLPWTLLVTHCPLDPRLKAQVVCL